MNVSIKIKHQHLSVMNYPPPVSDEEAKELVEGQEAEADCSCPHCTGIAFAHSLAERGYFDEAKRALDFAEGIANEKFGPRPVRKARYDAERATVDMMRRGSSVNSQSVTAFLDELFASFPKGHGQFSVDAKAPTEPAPKGPEHDGPKAPDAAPTSPGE